jgi:adenylate cyclase
MALNIEIKARVRDFEGACAAAEELSDTPCEIIEQEDTFFPVPQGRLKLRTLAPDSGQLIYYERPDTSGPKASHYIIAATPEPHDLETLLAAALGVRGVVRKTRRLYLVGPTRIHLDRVEGLGAFLELEVVLEPPDATAPDATGPRIENSGRKSPDFNDSPIGDATAKDIDGEAVAADLMQKLGVREEDLVDVAYIDLLERKRP